MLTCINFFGGPGSGKSTAAAGFFYLMKKAGFNVEFAVEYAKSRVFEEHTSVFEDQGYMFAKQLRQLHRLEGKVDYVVCEAPLLMSVLYARERNYPYKSFESFVFEAHNRFINENYLLVRNHPYKQIGRVHTEEQANQLHFEVENILIESNDKYDVITSHDIQHIVDGMCFGKSQQ